MVKMLATKSNKSSTSEGQAWLHTTFQHTRGSDREVSVNLRLAWGVPGHWEIQDYTERTYLNKSNKEFKG